MPRGLPKYRKVTRWQLGSESFWRRFEEIRKGRRVLFKAVEPMEGRRSALGALNSPAGVKKLSRDLEAAMDQMAERDTHRGGYNCPTYSEIWMSPEDRSVQGRLSPAGKMQVGSHMDFSSVGTLPFDAVGGMPTARGGVSGRYGSCSATLGSVQGRGHVPGMTACSQLLTGACGAGSI